MKKLKSGSVLGFRSGSALGSRSGSGHQRDPKSWMCAHWYFAQSELDPSEPGYVDWRPVAASTSQNGAHPPRSGRPRKPRKPPGAQGIVIINYNYRQLIIFLPKFIPVSANSVPDP
jgi:hypothetical protein